jgi:hypothetical protein
MMRNSVIKNHKQIRMSLEFIRYMRDVSTEYGIPAVQTQEKLAITTGILQKSPHSIIKPTI